MAERNWCCDKELAPEVHASLKSEEKNMLRYSASSPHLPLRRYMVDWIAIQAENFKMSSHTVYLAVFLLDRMMDWDSGASERHLHIVAMACLLIATKFEEKEEKVVQLSKFINHILNGAVKIIKHEEFVKLELHILDIFSWKINVPTAVHFVDYYLTVSVVKNDRHNGQPISNSFNAMVYLKKYSKYFLDISLQNHTFSYLKPSLLAAACIAASRICLHLSPTWTLELRRITSYTWSDIASFIEIMLQAHEADELAQVKKTTPETIMESDQNPFLMVQGMEYRLVPDARVS